MAYSTTKTSINITNPIFAGNHGVLTRIDIGHAPFDDAADDDALTHSRRPFDRSNARISLH